MSADAPDSLIALSDADIARELEPVSVPSDAARATFSNWADTFVCRPARVFEPTSVRQCRLIVELARRQGARVHPVGVGHSPSDLACTNGWLLRMTGVTGVTSIDHDKKTAIILGGTTLHQVHAALAAASPALAMPNLGSISDQTIAGLISTASHGSGVAFPVLSQHVRALTLVLPQPGAPVVAVSPTEDPELFMASLCGLGATGLIIDVEFEVVDAFRIEETKTAHSIDDVLDNLDEIKASAEHVRVWWYPDGKGMVVGRANRTQQPAQPKPSLMAHILGYHVTQFFLLASRYVPSLTPAVGRWAWWLSKEDSHVIDDGYKVLNFDCLFPQYALEWAVDAKESKACLDEIRRWLDAEAADPAGLRTHFPVEIRWSCADHIWLSPCYGRETVWIGVVTYRPYGLPVPYRQFQERFAEICAKHGGRPHWAKTHLLRPAELRALYPEFDKFVAVIDRVDPDGILRNEYVRRHIGGEDVKDRLFKRRAE
ncbi:D-arabinono-1,4-lactone oxidase [Cryptotrichosporon argae]